MFATAGVADSLAGRMRTVKLWPLSVAEVVKGPVCRLMDWAVQKNPVLGQLSEPAPVTRRDFRHLKWFAKDGPGRSGTCTGIVFYLGEVKLTFGNRNFALPVSSLWSEVEM